MNYVLIILIWCESGNEIGLTSHKTYDEAAREISVHSNKYDRERCTRLKVDWYDGDVKPLGTYDRTRYGNTVIECNDTDSNERSCKERK